MTQTCLLALNPPRIRAVADQAAPADWTRARLRLGSFADGLTEAVRIPYADIPTFPRSTAVGHAGQLVVGKSGEIPVAVMQGRVHLYEGYPAAEVAFPVRVLGRMGIRALILTNAAGGINVEYGRERWSSCAITSIFRGRIR